MIYICFFQELMKRRQCEHFCSYLEHHTAGLVFTGEQSCCCLAVYLIWVGLASHQSPTWCPPGRVWDVSKQENAVRRTKMSHEFFFFLCIALYLRKKSIKCTHKNILVAFWQDKCPKSCRLLKGRLLLSAVSLPVCPCSRSVSKSIQVQDIFQNGVAWRSRPHSR